MEDMEAVFRALADPHRRRLLDGLRERDGQALGQLEALLPEMTRFGVMKHLRILEGAGLVTTRRHGRLKLHFLNPVPIRLISDRWISRYAAPWVNAMAHLKTTLEAERPMPAPAPKQVYEIFIRASVDRVWQGITDGELTKRYYFGTAVETDLTVGGPFNYLEADGSKMIDGEVLEVDPPRRLVTTFAAKWDPALVDDPPSRVTFELTPMGELTRLTLTHDGFENENATFRDVAVDGWSYLLSSLKTLLETGEPMPKIAMDEQSAGATA
jgi:uncharacterized protein YndB with AHSA1/START domain/DNA-binding transcriptional ArsR family regulator